MNIWSGKLLNEVKFGQVIIIGGIVKPNPIKISIDFSQNENINYKSCDNIILHLSVRFNEKQIIRSSHFPNIGWSDEQISENLIGKQLKNPLKPGQQFTIRLTILQSIYQIHINEELYCTYDQNGPVNEITFIHVKYDYAKINHFDHHTLFPQVFPCQQQLSDGQQFNKQQLWQQHQQSDNDELYIFNSDLSNPLKYGNSILLNGIVSGMKDGEFGIDIINNISGKIIMRFNPKFQLKHILLTAQRNDLRFYPEDEENVGLFPFKRGHQFEIGISLQRNSFHFYINGNYLTSFNFSFDETNFELATIKCWINNGLELKITSIKYYQDSLNLSHSIN